MGMNYITKKEKRTGAWGQKHLDVDRTVGRASQEELMIKNLPTSAGDVRDTGSTPGLGRSLGGGHGNSLQYSCLENPMDRGTWWATVHRVAKSQTWLKWLSTAQNSWQETLRYHRDSEMKVFHYQWRVHTVLTSLESSNMIQTDNTNDNTQEMYQIFFCMPT